MVVVTLYYSDTCPACISFKPTWNELKRKTKALRGVEYREYNPIKDQKRFMDAKIEAIPTVHFTFKKQGSNEVKTYEYTGDRTVNDLYSKIKRVLEMEGK